MARVTSALAYRRALDSGLISKSRWVVYDWLFHNGPATTRTCMRALGKFNETTRFSDLKRQGVVEEVGLGPDPETGHESILWDVTDREPVKLVRTPSAKTQLIVDLKLRIADLEDKLEEALNENLRNKKRIKRWKRAAKTYAFLKISS